MSRAARRRAAAQRAESAGGAGDIAAENANATPATASAAPSAPVWWRLEQAWLVVGQMLVWGAILVVWLGRGGTRVVDLPADGNSPASAFVQAVPPAASASGPAPSTASASPAGTSDPAWPRLLIDPNTASATELGLLPGIGPKMAERILAERARRGRFETAEQLLDVPGIGVKTLARMRPYLHFPPAAAPTGK